MNTASHTARLWSPKAVNVLSFFLLAPAALLTYSNSKAIGDKKRASLSILFVFIGVLLPLIAFFGPDLPSRAYSFGGLALFAAWITTVGNPVRLQIEQQFPDGYRKRSMAPWFIAAGVIYALIIGSMFGLFKPGTDKIAQTVQEIYKKQWQTVDSLANAVPGMPKLHALKDDTWRGSMSVEQAGITKELDLRVEYDADKGNVEAMIQHDSYGDFYTLAVLPGILEANRAKPGQSTCTITDISVTKQYGDSYTGSYTLDVNGKASTRGLSITLDASGDPQWKETEL